MRLTSASVLWAPVASAVGFRAAVAAADAEARGTAYEHLRAGQRKDLPPKLTHHDEGEQDVDDAEKTTKSVVDLTDADNDAEILLSDDATTRTVDAGMLPRAAKPGGGAGGAFGTDAAHWSVKQPRKLKAAKETKAPKQAKKQAKCAKGFCEKLGGSGYYGDGTCSKAPPDFAGGTQLFVNVALDANDAAPGISWVLKRGSDDEVIVNCSLDSDQCQSPSAFTRGSTLSTTVTVNPEDCYTVTMYSCSGQGIYGEGSWFVGFNQTQYVGSNTTFSADSISVGDCDDD